MKVDFMARMALSVLLPCIAASTAVAQDAVPETPPELRDFRLDPERPPPQAQPQPEVQPPPVAPTVEPEASAAQPRVERAAPSRDTQQSEGASAPEVNRAAEPLPGVESEPQTETVAPPETVRPPAAEVTLAPTPSSGLFWWEVAAAVAAALALLVGWRLFRRRRKGGTDIDEHEPVTAVTPPPAAIPPLAPARPITVVAKRPQITLEFIPEKATLGFSALTLKGQLQLVNNGDAPASDMQLRLAMISANPRQNETIAAFTGGSIPIEAKPLGEAKAGERLALDIEMAVQVSELDSYMIGDKKIFVPVMLANLSYDWDGGTDNVTMAWMVGRESAPLQEKMGPLRLDLGPRNFSPLGQRPIYA